MASITRISRKRKRGELLDEMEVIGAQGDEVAEVFTDISSSVNVSV